MNRISPRFMLAVLLLTAVSAVAQSGYDIQPLDVPGATRTRAFGMNDRGQIVGDYIDPTLPAGHRRRSFVFSAGVFTDITAPLPPDSINGVVRAINNRGDVIGTFIDLTNGTLRGFLRRDNLVTVLDYPGAFGTQPNGLNDRGQIVGAYWDADGMLHSFLYADGVFTNIDPPGKVNTEAAGIAPNGEIVGGISVGETTISHCYRLRNGEYTFFDVPNAVDNLPTAVNARGDIAGLILLADGTQHAFVLDKQGSETILPLLDSIARGINARGDVTGWFSDDQGRLHGFLATQKGRK